MNVPLSPPTSILSSFKHVLSKEPNQDFKPQNSIFEYRFCFSVVDECT